ncbi:DUF1615 domain-containing protein [Hydrocarboniphaga effusa]|uniref:DUF1615 domain-containing protein n=1 Tax=Hydrocarboniphaga effusa TaxID=243629 RepID=UPI00313849C8
MRFRYRGFLAALCALIAAGCASEQRSIEPAISPTQARALIARALPASAKDRDGWTTDIYAAFAAMELQPSVQNVCSVIAVTEQESSFQADPTVANLPAIAWKQIDEQAAQHGVPKTVVRTALKLPSSTGKSYSARIDAARTERDLSEIFDELTARVPLGRRFFADRNPVRTGGPMQVGIAYAQSQAQQRPYPYVIDENGGVRREVFTRRGGLYFGIAHLLDYPANYDSPLYRFADYNAGHYASRNAAFQSALTLVSGIPLDLDGDLVLPNSSEPGATERAARVLGKRLELSDGAIRRDLEKGDGADFERSRLYERVFELADRLEGKPAARALLPQIRLNSPKITRKLTTAWFAERVQERYERCLVRAAGR